MEVASPIVFSPAAAGAKRGLSCSPDLMDSLPENMEATEDVHRAKRRRFGGDVCVDMLSERLSSHSPFFSGGLHGSKGIFGNANNTVASHSKRVRQGAPSPVQNDLNRVIEEQAAVIESLKKEKADALSSMESLKSDHERTCKENTVLRKAVAIQQERLHQAENQVKAAQEYRSEAEDRIKKLEQVILSLRYHLQAQQSPVDNDFLNHPRPPDVY